MSDQSKKGGKKGGKNATPAAPASAPAAAPAPSADALLDLVASKIDSLEVATGNSADDSSLTKEEVEQVNERMASLSKSLESQPPAEQITLLLDLFKTELQQRLISSRQCTSAKEKVLRSLNQKKSLENLCKELQARNKKLLDEVRVVSVEQAKSHAEMKDKFEVNLNDIQTQLNKHTEERMSQAKENEKLRENLNQLLQFDSKREEFFTQQLKTKELELKLSEAKLAQQAEFAAQETKKSKIAEEKILHLTTLETTLRQQLSSYAEKFESVQSTLTKSNELFANFKSEMEKTSQQMKKMEKVKIELEKKNAASQLSLLQLHEEKQADQQSMEKLKRQNQVLTNLCKELKSKSSGITADPANKENEQEVAAGEASSASS